MTVVELSGYLKEHWPAIREQLLAGQYQPLAVRRVEIDKPGGRTSASLAFPACWTVIQQALLQVLNRS
jgi:RNA-directed DNA polymerase